MMMIVGKEKIGLRNEEAFVIACECGERFKKTPRKRVRCPFCGKRERMAKMLMRVPKEFVR